MNLNGIQGLTMNDNKVTVCGYMEDCFQLKLKVRLFLQIPFIVIHDLVRQDETC